MSAEQTNIKVVVRVRPYNRRELEQNQRQIVKVLDDSTLLFDPDEEDDEFFFQGTKQNYRDITKRVNKKISMDFDRVFDPEATNRQIFEECTSPLVASVLNGYNCSVFVYGATGAGKTFTMLGSDTCPGLTFLTMRELFEKMQAQSSTHKFDVGVSYLEVYNELVMNLLTKTGPLKLREDSNGVVVSGLVLKPIYSADELLQMLAQGNANRTQHPTDANAESSRSHAIFQVHIRMTDRKTGTKRTVKLSMIDLAGSERAASTKGIGVRFKEGASINKSLLALGNCINKLADGMKHIPYRDSNLTRILKDSLGGNCQTLMVANVSMSSLTYEDTYNTLKYASRAKKIRTTLKQNVLKSNMPKDFYIKRVTELMAENERLKAKVTQLEKSSEATRSYNESELKAWYSKIDAVYSSVIKTQEYVIGNQSKIKSMNFREKLKKENIAYNKQLERNSNNLQEVLLPASTSGYNKEIARLEEESMRWRRKLHDANKDLEKLKKEIKESKYVEILKIYEKGKDLEVRYSKQDININHISGINAEFLRDSDKLRRAFGMACEVLQKSYDDLNTNMQDRYEQLQHFIKTHAYFGQEDYKKDSDEDLEVPTLKVTNAKRLHKTNDADMPTSTSTVKRHRSQRTALTNDFDLGLDITEDTDSDDCVSTFKKPAIRHAIMDETHVLSCATDDEHSTITDLSGKKSASESKDNNSLMRKKHLVSNILSEQIARVPMNKDRMKNVLLKSKSFNHHGLLKTVAAGVQKENKKFSPVRVRKSPRSIMVKSLAATANIVKRQAVRTVNSNNSDPIVRINRAASFRVKK
ncbi:kinesin-like protein KIF18A [Zeugodacus cucurbitae]|uniref:Kinesin-like protein KIF18A n=2 Tax=Zeugodacus cucurbitae TaxID=28588 RepID=A0A0A1XIQ4_ZEUCU|nr:kinesin-like protein KIF18A [Zeugodacus cucurbitae]